MMKFEQAKDPLMAAVARVVENVLTLGDEAASVSEDRSKALARSFRDNQGEWWKAAVLEESERRSPAERVWNQIAASIHWQDLCMIFELRRNAGVRRRIGHIQWALESEQAAETVGKKIRDTTAERYAALWNLYSQQDRVRNLLKQLEVA